ncbi:hypothetical protein CTAYLR_004816 [Chrysophaeum taylorii]|uniref:5'-nucleotidase n=1 Tax=Chrysophaeum taylorii TaxID=2483200 RepID=A0AAD7UNK3_9STRA|nr:hypothetical protein CTAYLR_004816 [Chrysophaeum taylorii]
MPVATRMESLAQRRGVVCATQVSASSSSVRLDNEEEEEEEEEEECETDEYGFELEECEEELERQIFCNRELNMNQIKAVGFDMDYTLAQYNVEFDLLAFEGAKEKLIGMGYPAAAVLGFSFDPNAHRRGLVIDKIRGNVIKVDRHKYCKAAYHGTRELTAEERKRIYVGVADETPTFTGDDYVNVDSLFQLIDASLFAQIVDAIEAAPDDARLGAEDRAFLLAKPFREAYTNVRHAVDLCHHDGVIKDRVAEDPGKYILPDPDLVPMLRNFKQAGKQVFCLTNSLFDYTNVVMNFLTGSDVDGREWLDLFDLVIVGAAKPAFLSPDARRDLLRVDVTTNRGTLHNLCGAPVFEVGADAFLEREGKVFQGGGYKALHALLQLESGSQLLYVGDHIFSDVLRSKRSLGWRTALVVPELEDEIRVALSLKKLNRDVDRRIAECDAAETLADEIRRAALVKHHLDDQDKRRQDALLNEAEIRKNQARDALRVARAHAHSEFHEEWGSIFRAGHIASRFAKQVVDYACIYTSRASNLLRTSPYRHFRPHADSLPHDVGGV